MLNEACPRCGRKNMVMIEDAYGRYKSCLCGKHVEIVEGNETFEHSRTPVTRIGGKNGGKKGAQLVL